MNLFRFCTTAVSIVNECGHGLLQSSPYQIRQLVTGFVPRREAHEVFLQKLHERKHYIKKKWRPNPLGPDVPNMKGVVLRTVIKKPRKPNSANRKCVLVRLSNGKEMFAYVPGEGHNLQEHSTVMVRPGRTKDTPGLKIKCIRGKYDLGHVIRGDK